MIPIRVDVWYEVQQQAETVTGGVGWFPARVGPRQLKRWTSWKSAATAAHVAQERRVAAGRKPIPYRIVKVTTTVETFE